MPFAWQVTSVAESSMATDTGVQGLLGVMGVLAVPVVGYSLYTLYNTGALPMAATAGPCQSLTSSALGVQPFELAAQPCP